jgi:transposase
MDFFNGCQLPCRRLAYRKRAEAAMNNLLADLEPLGEKIPELKTLAFTLTHWRHEILNYFDSHLTNAMTEGFNNKIKLIKRMAYGYRNQNFYFLRLLKACYH